MTAEHFLSEKLQKFSILDLGLVKLVYFFVSLLIATLYPAPASLSWFFYLLITLLCAMPLVIHLVSQKGDVLMQMHAYVKTNNPSNQVLLFLSMFFFALMCAALIPALLSVSWWIYLVIIVVLAIKPLTVTWFW